MADDYVPASPITLKSKKRKGGLLQRRAKKHRGRSERVADEASTSANAGNEAAVNPVVDDFEDETIHESAVTTDNLDINALYWPESDGETSKDLQHIDIYYEARILEQANLMPVESQTTNNIPLELIKGEFLSVATLSQQLNELPDPIPKQSRLSPEQTVSPPKQPIASKPTYGTEFVTDSEIVRVCEVVDAISDLHRNIPKFSQWKSPCASTPGPSKQAYSSFQEIKAGPSKDCIKSTPQIVDKNKPGTSYARKKYGREIEKAARKRINFFDDSDSKSSLSSELSLQSNKGIQFTPLDDIDLNKSFHVHENIHNLSSYFSQSFVEDDVDSTTNGVFRYIMLMKSKRKDAKMIHWFRSGKNFAVNETRSSKSFEGFSKSKKTSTVIDSSQEDINELLDQDENCFQELSREENINLRKPTVDDINSILQNADRVLQEVSEFDTNIEEEINNILEPKSTRKENCFVQGMNIDTLLHGKIIQTPKMNRFSEGSIPDCTSGVMQPRVESITASDIEFDSEHKLKEGGTNPTPPNLDTTFIVPKTPEAIEKLSAKKSEFIAEPKTERNLFPEESVIGSHVENRNCVRENKLKLNEKSSFKEDHGDELMIKPQSPLSNISKLNNNYKPSAQGFQSASGKSIQISKKAFIAAEKMMVEEIALDFGGSTSAKAINSYTSITDSVSNVAQNSVVRRDKLIDRPKMNERVRENNENSMSTKKLENANNFMTGFSTAAGRNLFVSKIAQEKAHKIIAEIDNCEGEKVEMLKGKAASNLRVETSRLPHSNYKSDEYIPNIQSGKGHFENNKDDVSVSSRINMVHDECSTNSVQTIGDDNIASVQPEIMGFQSASGKSISISTKAQQKAIKMMQEVMDDLDNKNEYNSRNQNAASNVTPCGKICSNNSINKNLREQTNIIKQPVFSCGFQTASGSSIKISEAARLKAEKFLAEVDNQGLEQDKENHPASKSIKQPINTVGDSLKKPFNAGKFQPNASGFQIASGKSISVSNAALEKAQKLLAEVDDSVSSHQTSSVVDATNGIIEQTPIRRQRVPTKVSSLQREIINIPVVKFQSASGKSISVSKEALAKAERIMAEDEDDILGKLKLSQLDCGVKSCIQNENIKQNKLKMIVEANEPNLSSPITLKRTLRSNSIENRAQQSPTDSNRTPNRVKAASPLINSKRVLRSNSTETRISPLTGSITTPGRVQSPLVVSPIVNSSTPQRSISEIAPTKSRLSLSTKRFKPPTSIAEKSSTPVRPIPLHLQAQTPNLQEFFNSVDTSTPKNTGLTKSRRRFTLSQEVSASAAALLDDEAEVQDIPHQIRKVEWSLKETPKDSDMPIAVTKATGEIINQRIKKRDDQGKLIRNKSNFQGLIQGGELFLKKAQSNRTKLKDLIKDSGKPNYIPTTFENILNHKFTVSTEEIFIATENGAFIVPDDKSCIGFEEIKSAFLSLPSVSLSLIPVNWVQHHYKMIFHKLHWLDTISSGVLDPRNICLQLKYRYDHELDRAHRSTLRKVLECDESPAKRMVLIVIAIHNTNFNKEIELSDRWYSVKTEIDTAMQCLVEAGKIKVGTKLMIQSAELLNCEEGCDPLAIPGDVRLKIHTNSTRRAKWNTKLGLYKVQKPFLLNLGQIAMHGKIVTRLEVYILRVYPSLFMREGKENGNLSKLHSEKVEKQLRQQEDISKLSTIEAIFSQVQKELDKEERQSSASKFNGKKNIKEISDPAELYELIRWEGDTSEIEAELSCVQRSLLASYQHQIHAERMQKVHKRVQSKLQNQSKTPKTRELFKIRVIDYNQPKETAIISIWGPNPDIKNLLQEHTALEITHLMPKDIHSYELQLTSTKRTQYKVLQRSKPESTSNQNQRQPIPEHYFRHVSSIQEIYSPNFKPAFNELDTYGLIVMIEDGDSMQRNHSNRFQSVYMSDFNENILCLNFWNRIKDYGYEDVIQVHRYVAVNNLEWRNESASGIIRAAFVMSTTTFTENPRNQDMIHALETIKKKFHSKYGDNTSEFVERCREKIKEIKSRPKALSLLNGSHNNTNNSSMNSLASTSMNASTSLNNSSRIRKIPVHERLEKLKIYGNPPNLSPIRMKCSKSVRRDFKPPTRVGDDSIS